MATATKTSQPIRGIPGASPRDVQTFINQAVSLQCDVRRLTQVMSAVLDGTLGRERPDIYMAIPPDGTNYDILPGTTVFDFWLGVIKHPDGRRTKMRTSLRQQEYDYMRAMRLEVGSAGRFWLDGNGDKRSFSAFNPVRLSNQEFRAIYVDAEVETTVKLWVSTGDTLVEDNLTVLVQTPAGQPVPFMVVKPIGDTRVFTGDGTNVPLTTGSDYGTVCYMVPEEGQTLDLAYWGVSPTEDIWVMIDWGEDGDYTQLTPETLVAGGAFFPNWVPSEYVKLVGDGSKMLRLRAKSAGSSGTVHGEMVLGTF